MVDIIVPIYNAYKAVEECINSIIKHTDLTKNRLILINDKSTDENILGLLNSFKNQYASLNIIVLDNEINLGFVGTVNKGMEYSDSDVILLNSDTEVSDFWVEEMEKCAYSQDDVATVTALSNNATLASVPNGLQPNKLPDSMSFDEYANMVYSRSLRRYPQIPTAHGFCMYIRRNALNVVGLFDQQTFGKGYGEENDFSYRCMDFGYKHLLCDSVIVYHKESQSFNEKKEQLINANMKILRKRYPLYVKNTENWCSKFPIKDICDNVRIGIENRDRSNILFLIHDWSNVHSNVGGTTIHCLDLISRLRNDFNIHVLAPENDVYKLHSYFKDSEICNDVGLYKKNVMSSFYDADYRKMLETIIDGLGITTVHVHHMIGHYFDVVDVCREKHVQSIITLHDFYSLCPTINLLYMNKEYCMEMKNKDCVNCLKDKMDVQNNIVKNWQVHWGQFLQKFDQVIVPSNSTKEIIENVHTHINCEVIEHGIDLERNTALERNEKDVFNVAFVGVMLPHKGSKVLEYFVKHCKHRNIKFHLFGIAHSDLLKKNHSNYEYHGVYKRNELPRLLKENKIHLVCNLSIWPETYSYTLTETIACGVPVLSYNIGAVGERILKNGFGWILENKDMNYALKKISEISKNLDEYNTRIRNINSYSIKSTSEMCLEYKDMYKSSNEIHVSHESIENLCRLFVDNNQLGTLMKEQITDELKLKLNSRRWRMVQNIRTPRIVRLARKVLTR
jgi:putative glycosyltransferase